MQHEWRALKGIELIAFFQRKDVILLAIFAALVEHDVGARHVLERNWPR